MYISVSSYIFYCQICFQVGRNDILGHLAGVVAILTWIQTTFRRELL